MHSPLLPSASGGSTSLLVGSRALLLKLQAVQQKFANDKQQLSMADLDELMAFRFLMDEEQRSSLAEWAKAAVGTCSASAAKASDTAAISSKGPEKKASVLSFFG